MLDLAWTMSLLSLLGWLLTMFTAARAAAPVLLLTVGPEKCSGAELTALTCVLLPVFSLGSRYLLSSIALLKQVFNTNCVIHFTKMQLGLGSMAAFKTHVTFGWHTWHRFRPGTLYFCAIPSKMFM